MTKHSIHNDQRARRTAERPVRLIFLGVLLLAVAIGPGSRWEQICGRCGCRRTQLVYSVPLTELNYWTMSRVDRTAFSKAVSAFVEPHHHDWLTENGHHAALPGSLIGPGPGRWPAVNAQSAECLRLLMEAHRHAGPAAAQLLLRQARSTQNAHQFRRFVTSIDVPQQGWKTAADFYEALQSDHARQSATSTSEALNFIQLPSPTVAEDLGALRSTKSRDALGLCQSLLDFQSDYR